jgi:hypothetical protein
MDGWVGGCKNGFKDCLQQSKMAKSIKEEKRGESIGPVKKLLTWNFKV